MLELGDRIREFIDSGATPVTMEEIRSSVDAHARGMRRTMTPPFLRASRLTLVTVILVAALVVLGIVLFRSRHPKAETSDPLEYRLGEGRGFDTGADCRTGRHQSCATATCRGGVGSSAVRWWHFVLAT